MIEREIEVALAGLVAERILTGKHERHGSRDDLKAAAQLAANSVGSNEELSAYLELLKIRTSNRLSLPFHWAAVQALATRLVKDQSLGYKTARAIIKTAIYGYRPTVRPRILSSDSIIK